MPYRAPGWRRARCSRIVSLAFERACTRHRTRHAVSRAIARARPRKNPRSCRAQGDASDRLPALRTTDSNARAPVVSRRGHRASVAFRRRTFPKTLVPRLSPRAHPRAVAAARRPLAGRRRAVHRAARGRSMPMRPGRTALHGALLTAPPRRPAAPGVFFRVREAVERRLASLSPPSLPCAESLSRSARGLEGRQDRLRGGPVKDVRFCGPRCLPSPVAPRLAPVPKHERTTTRSSVAWAFT